MALTPRQLFSSRTATVLSMIGVAVGLGNVWRFPYMMGRYGGSAFLCVYLAFTAFFAIPALMGELALGRATRKGPVGAFRAALGGRAGLPIGLLLLITVLVADSYYVVVIANVAYSLWAGAAHGFGPAALPALRAGLADGAIQYPIALALLAASLYVIHRGLRSGIERISKLFVPFFWLVAAVLIVGALSLPGAFARLGEFVHPDFAALKPAEIFAAMGQAIFSLGLGGTFMLVYGGYVADDTDIPATAVLTAVGNSGASLLTALFVVPAMLVFGLNMTQGPTLIFDTLPRLFHRLPYGALLGGAFLAGLVMVAFLSNVAALEVLYAGADEVPGVNLGRGRLLLAIGALEALLMLPSSFYPPVIAYLDLVFGSGMQAVGCALAVIALTWGLGKRTALAQIFGSETGAWRHLYFQWLRWAVPGALVLALCAYLYQIVS